MQHPRVCRYITGSATHPFKRFAGGISTEPNHMALNEIQKVGAGGNYLQEMHTVEHFKECWYPELFARGSYEAWETAGGTSLADRC